MKEDRPKIIVIAGPTASGKSSLAVNLALYFGGEIISSDSMQVYRGMDVGTAKLSIQEKKGVAHHMIDMVDPDEDFNAALYRSLAEPIVKDIVQRKKLCFVVGGTGLYIKVLLGGLLKCPPVNQRFRNELIHECEDMGSSFLHEKLKALDPVSALKIHPNDRTRVIRAMEVVHLTDQALSSLILQHDFKDRPFQSLKICIYMDRDLLYKRINERCVSMIKSGLFEETQTLLKKGYSSDLRSMNSLGYRHAVKYLKDEYGFEETILQLQRDTRRYAKRQLTWFRADPEMVWAKPEEMDFINKEIEKFI
jgi:tRNA dimethylallyltransferase